MTESSLFILTAWAILEIQISLYFFDNLVFEYVCILFNGCLLFVNAEGIFALYFYNFYEEIRTP